jgi:hypothetical protein
MCRVIPGLHQPRYAASDGPRPTPDLAARSAALPLSPTVLHNPHLPKLASASLVTLVPPGYLAAMRRARERGRK